MGYQYSGGKTLKQILIPPFTVEAGFSSEQGAGMNWGEQITTYWAIAFIPGFKGEWRKTLSNKEFDSLDKQTAADILAWGFYNFCEGATDEAFFYARQLITGKGGKLINIPLKGNLDEVDAIVEYRHLHPIERGRYDYESKWNGDLARQQKHRLQIRTWANI